MTRTLPALIVLLLVAQVAAGTILVPMDLTQDDHLKAYGVAYWALEKGYRVEWLLNYRNGSFHILDGGPDVASECNFRGVAWEEIDGAQMTDMYAAIEEGNMEVVLLEKAPEVALYAPELEELWDDAVMLALEYAEIPYTVLWDEEVLSGELDRYDWLHLHHEDFTGQYGKFYASFRNAEWYRRQVADYEASAREQGYPSVSKHKKAVARGIRDYVARGGFLFAMCSATDSYDIALAAEGVDIVDTPYDGNPPEPSCQERLDFGRCVAFEEFQLITSPLVYEFSDIDMTQTANARPEEVDYFTLFEFSAKIDPVPTMLTQCHTNVVKGFMGQTTSYRRPLIKRHVTVLADYPETEEVKYIHGNVGRGTFTFLGGHDPEDYRHMIGDPPTILSMHRNSPGYRLILNNILFPAAEKKERKT
ncbi:MAG: asparagine synthetase B [Candidatus Eisenbacteria bacterium]|nr:asparagine synthetase B [Candidatus Eisenbacteria bacterium]